MIVFFNRYGVDFYILFVEVEQKLRNVAKGVILMHFNNKSVSINIVLKVREFLKDLFLESFSGEESFKLLINLSTKLLQKHQTEYLSEEKNNLFQSRLSVFNSLHKEDSGRQLPLHDSLSSFSI